MLPIYKDGYNHLNGHRARVVRKIVARNPLVFILIQFMFFLSFKIKVFYLYLRIGTPTKLQSLLYIIYLLEIQKISFRPSNCRNFWHILSLYNDNNKLMCEKKMKSIEYQIVFITSNTCNYQRELYLLLCLAGIIRKKSQIQASQH